MEMVACIIRKNDDPITFLPSGLSLDTPNAIPPIFTWFLESSWSASLADGEKPSECLDMRSISNTTNLDVAGLVTIR